MRSLAIAEPARDPAATSSEPPLRPWLPWIAVGLMSGALPATLPLDPAWAWWAGGLPLALLALLWPGRRWPLARRLALGLAAAGLGTWLARPPVDATTPPRLVELTGTVHRAYPGRYEQRLILSGVVEERGRLPPGESRVFVRVAHLVPAARPGDVVRVAGLWQVDPERADRSALRAAELTIRRDREDGPRAAAWRAQASLADHRGLMAALLLGRGAPPERVHFHGAGLLHVLAVSGLHLGLALGAIYLALSWCGVPWTLRQGVAIAAAFGYLWFTGGSLPTQRAALMAAAFFGHRLLGRQPHRLTAISLAIILLVVWNPAQVRTVSFQLTVAAVLGIATLGLDLVGWRRRSWPLQPWPLDRPSWRALLWTGRGALDALAIGTAASLAVLPLVGWHFGEAAPYAPVASVLVAAPLTLTLVAGLGWLLAEQVWPGGPWEGPAWLTAAGLGALATLAEGLAGIPGALLHPGAPAAWQLAVWPLLFLPLRDRLALLERAAAAALLLACWWLGI